MGNRSAWILEGNTDMNNDNDKGLVCPVCDMSSASHVLGPVEMLSADALIGVPLTLVTGCWNPYLHLSTNPDVYAALPCTLVDSSGIWLSEGMELTIGCRFVEHVSELIKLDDVMVRFSQTSGAKCWEPVVLRLRSVAVVN